MTEQVVQKKDLQGPIFIAGFWRRLGAFFIDILILGLFGFLLGWAFFDFFVSLGPWGRLLGFVVALLYFGILNSQIGGGQTLGKKILKIRVENVSGGYLKPLQSFTRFFIFGLFYFLNGAEIPQSLSNLFAGILIILVVFGMGGSIVYLFLFNKKTRQSLHDLIIRSVVVMDGANPRRKIEKIWRGHYAVVGLIFAGALAAPFVIQSLVPSELGQDLQKVNTEINNLPEVRTSNVSVNTTYISTSKSGNTSTTYFSAFVIVHQDQENYDAFADRVADLIFEKFPEITTRERLIIQIQYGYDIGIARWTLTRNYNYSIVEWVRRLNNHSPKA